MEHNLISVSQLCDKSVTILFVPTIYSVIRHDTFSMVFIENRLANVYTLNFNNLNYDGIKWPVAGGEDANLWYRRPGHASMGLLQFMKELVWDLSLITCERNKVCKACIKVNLLDILSRVRHVDLYISVLYSFLFSCLLVLILNFYRSLFWVFLSYTKKNKKGSLMCQFLDDVWHNSLDGTYDDIWFNESIILQRSSLHV